MRILHFSDFHLNGSHINEAKHNLDYMIKALKGIDTECKIDLVIFTGDMLEQGGAGYNNVLSDGFKDFKSKVIIPLMKAIDLPESRFIFTPGNHDIDQKADSPRLEDNLEKQCNSCEGIIGLTKADDVDDYTKRVDEFKTFETNYYSEMKDIEYNSSKFVSTYELDIDGVSIGISSLNTVWRCSKDDTNKIAMGVNQITEHTKHLHNKAIKIALTHYPISLLKLVEREKILQKTAKEFDIMFCGHSHQGYVHFIVPIKGCALMEINTAGTLAANIYAHDSSYKNAFQIVDCYPALKYEVRLYIQMDSQEFEFDKNGGVNEIFIPDINEMKRLLEEHQIQFEHDEMLRIKHSIEPFVPLDDFINCSGNDIMKSKFETCNKIDEVKNTLLTSTNNCRFMALSGMGKTRIVAETFKYMDGVYYSRTDNCIDGLEMLLKYKKPKLVIIDNCSNIKMRDATKCINESDYNVRLITIHNVLTPEEKSTSGNLLVLDYDCTEEVVEKMIANEIRLEKNPELAQMIRERSGKIPYMAILLIKAYKSKGNFQIDNPNEVLNTILSGSEILNVQKKNVLRAISLFEPLGKENSISDEYEFVTHTPKIHHINQGQNIINNEFTDTINDYINRQLVEHSGYCIRVRPRPLAEWLTESWLIEYGSCFADVLDDINAQKSELKDRIFRALNSRMKEMSTSQFAKQVFDIINNPDNGSFHNERLAFSEAGSQLFLSMGLVSPVMVSRNLLSLLEAKSFDWLRNSMNNNVRRNLVWALENICMSEEAFVYGAQCLARLAVADNENISNNATGQFVQLFHLYLSGTKADLKQRILLLQKMRKDDSYLSLIVKALDNALQARDFIRLNTSGTLHIEETATDCKPTISEIYIYWRECAILMKGIAEQRSDLVFSMMEILVRHVSDFGHLRAMPILFDLLEFFSFRCGYVWPEMRDMLSMYLQYWFNGTESNREEVELWMKKLAPKDFFGRLKASQKDEHHKIDKDYQNYENAMYEQMLPFGEEFVKGKVYNTDELIEMMQDMKFMSYWFLKVATDVINKENKAVEVLNAILKTIRKLPKDFETNFISTLVEKIDDKVTVQRLQKALDDEGYHRMSASIMGGLDDGSHSLLLEMIEWYKDGKYDNICLNNYLHQYTHHTLKNIFEIFDALRKGSVSEKDVCFPYLLDHFMFLNISEINDEAYIQKFEDILLMYNFKDGYPYLNHQVVEAMEKIIDTIDDANFALRVHKRVVEILTDINLGDNPFDQIYFSLLPKYQDVILDNLLDVLSADDARIAYYLRMHLNLGSGFGSGAGPLFQCNNDKLKKACFKYPSTLPIRLAQMCPVYEYSEKGNINGFSDFFLWLCDSFGDQEDMLNEFSSNMGTFSWSGINGFSDFIAQKLPCFSPLLSHVRSTVRAWAEKQLAYARDEILREKGKEAYERMIRG